MSQSTYSLNHSGCISCSDAAVPVWAISVDGDDALCEDAEGNRERIAVELVSPVRAGEVLLTHGGVAIGRLETQEEVSQ